MRLIETSTEAYLETCQSSKFITLRNDQIVPVIFVLCSWGMDLEFGLLIHIFCFSKFCLDLFLVDM